MLGGTITVFEYKTAYLHTTFHSGGMTFANAQASSSARSDDFPLHLALSYILVRAYPQTPVHQTTFTYSHGFVSSILALVAREELEVSPATALPVYLAHPSYVMPQPPSQTCLKSLRRFSAPRPKRSGA